MCESPAPAGLVCFSHARDMLLVLCGSARSVEAALGTSTANWPYLDPGVLTRPSQSSRDFHGKECDSSTWVYQQFCPVWLHQRGSSVPDSNIIFQLHALSLAALGCRYWAECIESTANFADDLSQYSWDCPVAASLHARVY